MYTLARYQNVAAVNILYSSRGLLSVFLAAPLACVLGIPRLIQKRIKVKAVKPQKAQKSQKERATVRF